MKSLRRIAGPGICFLLAALYATPAPAIVIRHDRDDSAYKKLAKDYPAMAAISPDGNGVLIGKRWVLTAAHVAKGTARQGGSVRIGNRSYDVIRVFIHPQWKEMGAHDVGLLELAKDVKRVKPALLYAGDDEAGITIVFAGTGDFGTSRTGPFKNDGKSRAATNRVDSVDADWIYFTFNEGDAATDLEGVSGPGDSGGPALLKHNGNTYTLGVSAFGIGMGEGPGRYGVMEMYTRVSTHRDWIESTMAGKNYAHSVPFSDIDNAPLIDQLRRVAGEALDKVVDIPDTPVGTAVSAYLAAYNSGSEEQIAAFFAASGTPEFLASEPDTARIGRFHRMQGKYFGPRLTPVSIGEASAVQMLLMCRSSKGEACELQMEVQPSSPHRITFMQVAIVSTD